MVLRLISVNDQVRTNRQTIATESTALEHVGRSALDHPNLLGVGDPPFSRLALGFGVGFSVLVVAWTILRTISEGFGWPYYGWPY